MLLASGPVRTLGSPHPRLAFGEQAGEGEGPGARVLFLDQQPAFSLSWWCGSCPFLFERHEGSNDTVSIEELSDRLTAGLDGLDDDVLLRFGALLAEGQYIPLLVTVAPRLTEPVRPGDYFAEEQVATWGLDSFWGLPQYPRTAYYRTFEARVDDEAHLYEFVVPMLSPAWNDRPTVDAHAQRLSTSSAPTAVAVSTLDVCQPALDTMSSDYYAHWGLTHFLLDGHHKMQAAAELGRPLQLLSLLSLEGGLSTPDQVSRLLGLRRQPRVGRQPR